MNTVRHRSPGRPRRGLIAALACIASLAALWGLAHLFTSSSQFARAISWGDSDVGDRLRFASRAVPAGQPRFDFHPADPTTLGRYAPAFRTVSYSGKGAPPSRELAEFMRGTNSLAFLVIKDDVLLYEGYYNGASRDEPLTSFSVAKSFASALVGAAIAEGRIKGVDDPVTKYVPELLSRDPRFARIRLRDLLSMSSGIRYVERGLPWSDDASTYYSPDLRRTALSSRIDRAPGEHFLYTNYNPLLLGLVLERATGKRVADYLSEKIWSRIGAEAPASWSLDHEGGFEKMESGVNARALDFAKFARLYLRGGDWEGDRILPEAWIRDSTSIQAPLAGGAPRYGFFWWIMDAPSGEKRFLAAGKNGQYLYVVPARGLIVARFGKTDPLHCAWREVFDGIADRMQ